MQKNVLVIEDNPDIANLVMINLRGKQLQVDHAADGDIGMMQRVLENLLENGLRHTPSGGRVSINVDLDSTNVMVRIADSGCGIPPQDVPRIFERFYQRDKSASDNNSAGLGLAIVKRILELHGSVIKVRNELHRGTTFSFELGARGAV
jgi:hypothetical protein